MFDTPAQLQEALDKSVSPIRVTKKMIDDRIEHIGFTVIDRTVTICSITLDNGFSVRGESACVDPKNFNKDIGESIAHENAYRALWPLFGFLVAELRHRAGINGTEELLLNAMGEADGD